MNQSALAINNLEKTYRGRTHARPASHRPKKGDFFALLAPNGAGKTTLIGVVTGLVNATAARSKSSASMDKAPEKAPLYVGVVPQNMNFNVFESVIDIVVNQGGYYGIPRKVAIPRAEEILKGVGLYEKRNTAPARSRAGCSGA